MLKLCAKLELSDTTQALGITDIAQYVVNMLKLHEILILENNAIIWVQQRGRLQAGKEVLKNHNMTGETNTKLTLLNICWNYK